MRLIICALLASAGVVSSSLAQVAPQPAYTKQAPTYTNDAKPPPGVNVTSLAATMIPPELALEARLQSAVSDRIAADPEAQQLGSRRDAYRDGCSPTAAAFDWRAKGVVSPVKDQLTCGSCFVFSATAALEASWKLQNGSLINASEQHLLDCAGAGGCDGGFYTGVFRYIKAKGAAAGAAGSYKAKTTGACSTDGGPYTAINWAMVDRNGGAASPKSIKDALCRHGPLAAAVYATDDFIKYSGGVFNEFNDGEGQGDVNHAIVIVGWDDAEDAWIIKNSWGNWWGEKGFGRIRYRSNHIGYAAAWVDAVKVTASATMPGPMTPTEIEIKSQEAKRVNERVFDAITKDAIATPSSELGRALNSLKFKF